MMSEETSERIVRNQSDPGKPCTPLDVIVPVYNEKRESIQATLNSLRGAVGSRPNTHIIVVDDGSDEKYSLSFLRDEDDITLIRHDRNQGYGAALKSGILAGDAPWIAITDADGTYPVDSLPLMLEWMDSYDMVTGIRTGSTKEIPPLRRLPKALLNRMASYLARVRITDINSGLRVFTRDLCYYLWGLLPPRFSFTSTLTMGALLGGFRTKDIPIDYYKRAGHSSIRPIRDTLRFFHTILRLGLFFAPMRTFGPISAILLLIGIIKGLFIDYISQGQVGNMSITVLLFSLQIFLLGLMAELIVHSRSLKRIRSQRRDQP